MKKYNFNAYRKETLHSLQTTKRWIEREIQQVREKYDIQWKEGESQSWSITIPCDEYDEWVKWHAEVQYLNRLIRFRRIWDPRGWWKKIPDWVDMRCFYMRLWYKKRQEQRVEKMPKDKQWEWRKKQVQHIEQRIIQIAGKDDSNCTLGSALEIEDLSKYKREKLEALFMKRNNLLDLMFLATPIEVAQLEEINQYLRDLTKQLEDKISTLYRRDLSYGYEHDWSDEYEGYLVWNSKCKEYEGDDQYGSNFQKMLSIQQGIYADRDCLGACVNILKYPEPTDNLSMTDKELEVINKLDDEIDDWKEGRWSRIPEIAHIKVCYAMHHMFDHQNLSIVDILHLCEYRLELERRLCHYTEFHGRER
jgi:hypothetical protein